METGRDLAHDGPVLIVLEQLRRAACNDVHAWRGALAELEARWFAPLLEALKRGALQSVALHALGPDASVASISTRFDRFKFWRRKRRLADYLEAASK
jgi:hypothetical protein